MRRQGSNKNKLKNGNQGRVTMKTKWRLFGIQNLISVLAMLIVLCCPGFSLAASATDDSYATYQSGILIVPTALGVMANDDITMNIKYPLKIKELTYSCFRYDNNEILKYKNIEYLHNIHADKYVRNNHKVSFYWDCRGTFNVNDAMVKIIDYKKFTKLKKIVISPNTLHTFKDDIDCLILRGGAGINTFNPIDKSVIIYLQYNVCDDFIEYMSTYNVEIKKLIVNSWRFNNIITNLNIYELEIHGNIWCLDYSNLTIIRLSGSNIDTLMYLSNIIKLEELYIETSGIITSYDGVENLTKLRIIEINGIRELDENVKCYKDRIMYTYNYYKNIVEQYSKFNPINMTKLDGEFINYLGNLLKITEKYIYYKEIINKN